MLVPRRIVDVRLKYGMTVDKAEAEALGARSRRVREHRDREAGVYRLGDGVAREATTRIGLGGRPEVASASENTL